MDGIKLLSVLVLLSNIALLLVYILLLLSIIRHPLLKKIQLEKEKLIKLIDMYSLWIILFVTGASTFGSLYLSEVKGIAPCLLCWYQRVFMYPQVVLIITALYKKTKDIFKYTFVLSTIGLLIAVYQYNLSLHPYRALSCSLSGFSVSCAENYFTYFGYITIPWMSISAFLIIASISWLMIKSKKLV
jgi:disulfide bond formation protein DsbB